VKQKEFEMRKSSTCGLLAAAFALATGAAVAETGWATPDKLQSLSGTYVSSGVEEWYGGFGTREFVFDSGKWSLIFTHALDRKMTQRTFQFRTGGSYKVQQPSAAVKGAYHSVFNEDWKHVTLLSENPQIIARMGMADCKLTVNLETDISRTGCAAWRPVSVCGQDHDLFGMDAKGVYFGVRPRDNNMCTPDKTPMALLPPVVAR
jgi:hypothetical protein